MTISSRTPEGRPNTCPVCGASVEVEPSAPPGDAPCPRCGHLLWFIWQDLGDTRVIRPMRETLQVEDLGRLSQIAAMRPGVPLVLDLAEVRQVSSAALGRLVNLKRRLAGAGVRIENIHPDLREIFRIARVFDLGR